MADDELRADAFRAADIHAPNESTWLDYREQLAERLTTLATGKCLAIVIDTYRGPSRIQALRTGAQRLRLTFPLMSLDGTTDARLTQQVADVERLGWRLLNNESYLLERGQRRVGDLADRLVTTMRDIFGVHDPADLAGIDVPVVHDVETHVEIGVRVRDSEHLRALAVGAIEELAGEPVDLDPGDNDLRLPTEPVPSWLHVHRDAPRIELFAPLARRNPSLAYTNQIIAEQRGTHPFITLETRGIHVNARLVLESAVFHARNLESALGNWRVFLTEEAPGIIALLEGPADVEPTEPREMPDELATIVALDPEADSLSDAEVARICGFDAGKILELHDFCMMQCLSWRRHSATSDGPEDVELSREQLGRWEATSRQIHAALRFLALDEDFDEDDDLDDYDALDEELDEDVEDDPDFEEGGLFGRLARREGPDGISAAS